MKTAQKSLQYHNCWLLVGNIGTFRIGGRNATQKRVTHVCPKVLVTNKQ